MTLLTNILPPSVADSNLRIYANVSAIGYAELDSSPTFTGNITGDYIIGNGSALSGILPSAPRVSSVSYVGDDLAVLPEGDGTVVVSGTGFQNGCTVYINNSQAPTVTFTNTTSISFTTPALTAGNYVFYVVNPDGGTGISIPGFAVSGTPTWTTTAGALDSANETSYSVTVNAYSDSNISYAIYSGSLPSGLTLDANTGEISGTVESSVANLTSNTSYNFTVSATDEELQNVERAFTITYVPTFPTWLTPAGALDSGAPDTLYTFTLNAYSNSDVTYAIPSGNVADGNISLTGNVLSGTPASSNTYYFDVRATDQEGHYTDRAFYINIVQPAYTFSLPGSELFTLTYLNGSLTESYLNSPEQSSGSYTSGTPSISDYGNWVQGRLPSTWVDFGTKWSWWSTPQGSSATENGPLSIGYFAVFNTPNNDATTFGNWANNHEKWFVGTMGNAVYVAGNNYPTYAISSGRVYWINHTLASGAIRTYIDGTLISSLNESTRGGGGYWSINTRYSPGSYQVGSGGKFYVNHCYVRYGSSSTFNPS